MSSASRRRKNRAAAKRYRKRKKLGLTKTWPKCSVCGCNLKGVLSQVRLICSRDWQNSEAGKSEIRERRKNDNN